MAICQFYLSDSNRKCLGVTLAVFCLIQVIVGFILCGFAVYFRLHLQWKILLIEGYDSETLYRLILAVGLITIFLHLIGGKMCYDCGQPDTRSRFDKVLFLWLLLVFTLWITQFVTSMICLRHTVHARRQFEIGFISTMKNYLKNAETKTVVDKLQIDHECCGSENFKDWMITDWVPPEFNPFSQNPSLKNEYKDFFENMPLKVNLKENQLSVTPFSCCDPEYMVRQFPKGQSRLMDDHAPCFHDFITQPGLVNSSTPLRKRDWWDGVGLHTNGCVPPLMEAYNEYLTYAAYFFLSASGIQTIILVMARYLQTSVDNIPMFGREDGTAPGWLCECEML